MRTIRMYLIAFIAGAVILAGCAPKAAPAPQPPAREKEPVIPTALPPSSQPSEWDKVVAAAKKEGKLTAYSFHLIGDIEVGIARAFKNRYGIEVETISGPGMQLIERLKSEKRAGQGIGDILTTASSIVFTGKKEGLTQSVRELPVFAEQGIWHGEPRLDSEGHVIAFIASMPGLTINTNLVKPGEEPTSWFDLLKPEWKGKIALADPSSIPNAAYIYIALTKTKKADKEYFVKLGKQDLKIVSTVRDLSATVARGEVALSFAVSDSTTAPFAKEGAPIKAVDMKEGIPLILGNGLAMLADAPHPNATRVFINWFLSQEGQTTYAQLASVFSIRKDVPDTRPAAVRLTPKVGIVITAEDEEEISRIMRDKELTKLILGR